MVPYSLPAHLTQEQFSAIVRNLYCKLAKSQLDPVSHMLYHIEMLDDCPRRFEIWVSEEAAKVLRNEPHSWWLRILAIFHRGIWRTITDGH